MTGIDPLSRVIGALEAQHEMLLERLGSVDARLASVDARLGQVEALAAEVKRHGEAIEATAAKVATIQRKHDRAIGIAAGVSFVGGLGGAAAFRALLSKWWGG